MNKDFYRVSSLMSEDKYFACYEQAVMYAKELAKETRCGNAIYSNSQLIGLTEWNGYEPVEGGGYVETYEYLEYSVR